MVGHHRGAVQGYVCRAVKLAEPLDEGPGGRFILKAGFALGGANRYEIARAGYRNPASAQLVRSLVVETLHCGVAVSRSGLYRK